MRRWRGHAVAAVLLLTAAGVAATSGVTPDAPAEATQITTTAGTAGTVTAGGAPDGSPTGGTAPTADGTPSGVPAGPGSGGSAATPTPGSTGSTPGTAGPKQYDVGVSDTEIRIGASTFTSGPAAVYGEQIAVGLSAGIQYVNERGGVNGRKLTLKLYDDGGDPTKQLANAKRLVEVDQVFALATMYAPTVGEYVASKGVPVIQQGQFDEDFTNPWWFPLAGPQRTASFSLANFGARTVGVKSVAIFYLDAGGANYSSGYASQVASDWEAYGVQVPVVASFTPDQTSCSDALRQASAANVDFIVFELDAGRVVKCGIEAQIQSYKPPLGWGGYLIGVPAVHEALGDYALGMYAFDAFGAIYDNPDYQAAVRRVSPKTESYSSVTVSNFIGALLLRDALASLGDNITRERLAAAINGLTNWRPGLSDSDNQPTWTWRPECHVALRGGYVIQVQKQDGALRWAQITSQATSTPLPPNVPPPSRYAGCDIFSRG